MGPVREDDRRPSYLRVLVVCLGVMALLARTQCVSEALFGGDGYFHARLAWVLGTWGISLDRFPWLPFTRLADRWVDHELGWHILAIPWVMNDALLGGKVLAVFQGSVFVLSVSLILRRWGAPLPLFLALIPVCGSMWTLERLVQCRPQVLAVTLYLWGLVALVEGRAGVLLLLTLLLTWCHGSFFLLPVAAAASLVLGWLWPGWAQADVPAVGQRSRMLAAACLGAVLGLVVHPHFPATVEFFFWHVGIVAQAQGAGREWLPPNAYVLVRQNAPVVLGMLLGVVLGLVAGPGRHGTPRSRLRTAFLLVCLVQFWLLGIRHQRFSEYWVPLGVLWLGSLLAEHVPARSAPATGRGQLSLGLMLGLCLGLMDRSVSPGVSTWLRQELTINPFEAVARRLKSELPRGEVVFHCTWDYFTELFFVDVDHRYISGLDAQFLAVRHPELDALLVKLERGLAAPSLAIRRVFGARFALVRPVDEPLLEKQMRADPLTESVLETGGLVLYRIAPEPRLPLSIPMGRLLQRARVTGGDATWSSGSLHFGTHGAGASLELPLIIPESLGLRLRVTCQSTPPTARWSVSLGERSVATGVSADTMSAGLAVAKRAIGLAPLAIRLAGSDLPGASLEISEVTLESPGGPAALSGDSRPQTPD